MSLITNAQGVKSHNTVLIANNAVKMQVDKYIGLFSKYFLG